MSKLIEYFDPEKATIAVLRDYRDQLWKLENDPKRFRELSEELIAPKGMSAVPVRGGGNRREEKLCDIIDKKALIEHGYRQAKEYKAEFVPCWKHLTDDEQDVLTMQYVDHTEGGGIKRIMDKYAVSRSAAYHMCDNALKRLSKLLFW